MFLLHVQTIKTGLVKLDLSVNSCQCAANGRAAAEATRLSCAAEENHMNTLLMHCAPASKLKSAPRSANTPRT